MSELRVLLIAEEAAGIQVFRMLADSGHKLVAVMSSNEEDGRNASVSAAARRQGFLTLPARQVKDPALADWIRSARVDIILNVHSLYIVPDCILRAARIGAFNLHPGPLPQYAGLNTVSWAIYHGETSYGVTLHWMVPSVDAGDIAFHATFPIEGHDTPFRLMHKCVTAGVPLGLRLLEIAASQPEAIPRIPQDLTKRRYFGRSVPQGGVIDWSRTAAEIVNFVRACDYSPFPSPWGHPSTTLAGKTVRLIRAARTYQASSAAPSTLRQCDKSGLFVAAADEWVLVKRFEVDGRSAEPLSFFPPSAPQFP